jgi:hypothetical protein
MKISHFKQIFNVHAKKIEFEIHPNYAINKTHFRPFKIP